MKPIGIDLSKKQALLIKNTYLCKGKQAQKKAESNLPIIYKYKV